MSSLVKQFGANFQYDNKVFSKFFFLVQKLLNFSTITAKYNPHAISNLLSGWMKFLTKVVEVTTWKSISKVKYLWKKSYNFWNFFNVVSSIVQYMSKVILK